MSSPKRIKLENEPDSKKILFPVLSDNLIQDTPLIEVYVDTIKDPKTISKVITNLNAIFPIPELTHLKRVRGKDVILFPVIENSSGTDVQSILKEKSVDTTKLENNVKKVMLAKIPPKTRKQYELVRKLWPCNFHANVYLEKLCNNILFSKQELDDHVNYMRAAIDMAKLSTSNKNIGVVIVDPNINSIISVGFDQSDRYPHNHAVMIAIDNVAKTQLHSSDNTAINDLRGIPIDILENLRNKYANLAFGSVKIKQRSNDNSGNNDDGPYLCTGYYVYTTHEPCIACAMALVHSRVKRVFYGCKYVKGALGTLCKIHVISNLNHHYEVFAGLLENECSLL